MNKFSLEPLGMPVLQHKFRERNKSKEIQPEMRFSQQKTASPDMNYYTKYEEVKDRTILNKVYLKSTYSMLLRLGSLKRYSRLGDNTDARLYEVLAAEIAKLERKKVKASVKPVKLSLENTMKFKNIQSVVGSMSQRNASLKAAPKPEAAYSPRLSNISDPLMIAAEKLLVKSDVITRRKSDELGEYLKSQSSSARKSKIL
eukprot:TRINITY_DN12670_c0_g1_i6.p1 TRINITY_DN12670_c0_g1~~TRINITY_DN12670_c0_g1_i6.p1  ORF type:complete len:201 (-),score=42.68 TRINITY_DN12670_c0_g1_i6:139-741(-)